MKVRLAIIFSTLSVMILLSVFGYLYYFLNKNLDTEALEILNERFLLISDILKYNENGLLDLKNRIEHEWTSAQHEPLWIQVTLSDNTVWAQSSLYNSNPDGNYITSKKHFITNKLPLVYSPITVSLQLNRSSQRELLLNYSHKMIYLLIATIIISIISVITIVNHETEPILYMTKKIKSISPNSLHRRLKLDVLPTELIPLADSFNSMMYQLENSFSQVSMFSADIAHELRTPLNALMIKIEVMLEKKRSTKEYEDLLESLLKDTFDLSSLIDTLLFLARVDNQKNSLRFENLNLNNELKLILEFYEPLALEKEIQLKLESNENIIGFVEKRLFDRAIGNLIQNAIQYCPAGSKVLIHLYSTHDTTFIDVKDNGPGISSEHIPFLFNRLYRVDSSRNHNSGGLGLGLSIVTSVMKAHKGKAEVRSEKGKGSCFSLHFPKTENSHIKSDIYSIPINLN